ncbi:MAG: glycine cleavage system protein GcvH [SAR202 cluster bacterium]|jgi:glycine cleavage system H protein|nr:glycine cleavage system protein H [Chloroflexota bacterium]MCL0030937.1 glycine cleavage system protein GcvH [Dehalococcoidia bacterium]MDP6425684.1 glycine cleavage system protein GcvH [Dehalococcoidia bacterium]MDP7613162.1 glycine cleavage system protein GcvH [Dehalococcoidia bacterium]MQG46628.1 glycine cleavage system protein GcvH [SAR202 cluster bacterium]|tara:strand:+ start:2424 stop:2780 length:357 start_codon:yes stop_codon:yes gene_type:complete
MKYSKEHEWVKIEDGKATIGITNFAQESLGDIVYIDLPDIGFKIVQFEKFGEVESVKAVSDLYAPISGTIIEINPLAETNPETVNSSPHENGWLLRVDSFNLDELESLMSESEYLKII